MSMHWLLLTVSTLIVVDSSIGCLSPEVASRSFTTEDATIVSKIGYISQFRVKCRTGSFSHLYALLDGNVILAAPEVAPHEYQVSWTEDTSSARVGEVSLRIYDEEGYTLLKRAARSGDEILEVPYMFNIIVNHPGAFSGPWLKSEFLAAILASVVAYLALSSRSKLLS